LSVYDISNKIYAQKLLDFERITEENRLATIQFEKDHAEWVLVVDAILADAASTSSGTVVDTPLFVFTTTDELNAQYDVPVALIARDVFGLGKPYGSADGSGVELFYYYGEKSPGEYGDLTLIFAADRWYDGVRLSYGSSDSYLELSEYFKIPNGDFPVDFVYSMEVGYEIDSGVIYAGMNSDEYPRVNDIGEEYLPGKIFDQEMHDALVKFVDETFDLVTGQTKLYDANTLGGGGSTGPELPPEPVLALQPLPNIPETDLPVDIESDKSFTKLEDVWYDDDYVGKANDYTDKEILKLSNDVFNTFDQVAFLNKVNRFSRPQRANVYEIFSEIIDLNKGNNLVLTLTGNKTISSIHTDQAIGQTGVIVIYNAERITGWSAEFKFKEDPFSLGNAETFSYFVESADIIRIGVLR